MKKQHQNWILRLLIYVAGITILALGTILSTRTGLGVACITSAPTAISNVFGWNLSVVVFALYALMIVAQFIIKRKEQRAWRDLLQFPVAILFSVYLEWFGQLVHVQFDRLWQNLLMMVFAVFLIGLGVCLMVNMDIVPNPPDGLVHTISKALRKDMGLIKNITDTTFVAISAITDLLGRGRIVTVGVGTVYTMIFVGRTIYVINRFFKTKMRHAVGLDAGI